MLDPVKLTWTTHNYSNNSLTPSMMTRKTTSSNNDNTNDQASIAEMLTSMDEVRH